MPEQMCLSSLCPILGHDVMTLPCSWLGLSMPSRHTYLSMDGSQGIESMGHYVGGQIVAVGSIFQGNIPIQ